MEWGCEVCLQDPETVELLCGREREPHDGAGVLLGKKRKEKPEVLCSEESTVLKECPEKSNYLARTHQLFFFFTYVFGRKKGVHDVNTS